MWRYYNSQKVWCESDSNIHDLLKHMLNGINSFTTAKSSVIANPRPRQIKLCGRQKEDWSMVAGGFIDKLRYLDVSAIHLPLYDCAFM